MKKLNQEGWGLSVFLAFIIVFFIAIILIAIGSAKVGISGGEGSSSQPTNTPSGSTYTENEINQAKSYEERVKSSTSKYLLEKLQNQIDGEEMIIPTSTLNDNFYLDPFSVAGNICNGYSVVRKTDQGLEITPYVECGGVYTTEGYRFREIMP